MLEQIESNNALNTAGSIVEIEVLDKVGGNYKIVAGGGVFQSELPISVNVGEVLLAKIIKFKPVTLQLNKLFSEEQGDAELDQLLKKMGIRAGRSSRNLLRSLLKFDLPVMKSRMNKFLDGAEALDSMNGDLSDYLANMMWCDQNLQRFSRENAEYFNYTSSYLIEQIFFRFTDLNSGYYKEEAVEDLNKILITERSDLKDGKTVKENELEGRIKKLTGWFVRNSGSLNVKIKDLAALISIYLLHREYWKRVGILPEFAIIQTTEGFKLVKFSLKSISTMQSAENYLIDFQLDLKNLGAVNFSGLLTGRQFRLTVTAHSATEMKLEVLKDRLVKRMKNRLSVYLQLLISSFAGPSISGKSLKKNHFRSVNIKA